jgi:hypothetical protein
MKIKGSNPAWWIVTGIWMAGLFLVQGCSTGPMPGLIYTHLKYPLTWDLHDTKKPQALPQHAKIIEISEPFTGFSINAKLNSNAIGEIAKAHGIETLYFADQERFSILGIWTYHKVTLYGE